MYEEDLLKYTNELKMLKLQNKTTVVKEKLRIIGIRASYIFGGFILLMAVIFIFMNDVPAFFPTAIIGLLFIYLGTILSKRIYIGDRKKIEELQQLIAQVESELKKYKNEMRSIILEQERDIKEEKDENITDDFTFSESQDTKECPMCAETVKAKAKICRFCGYKFDVIYL